MCFSAVCAVDVGGCGIDGEEKERQVVREVIDTSCEMEPARKRAGFLISKIIDKKIGHKQTKACLVKRIFD